MPLEHPILWAGLIFFWLALAVIGWRAEGGGGAPPPPRPDLSTALAAWLVRLYLRTVHRLTVEGVEHAAAVVSCGRGVIVTANHAAGIDPLMVQAGLPFFVRWLVAGETVAPTVLPFVEFAGVIFLTGSKEQSGRGELTGVREAVRHVQSGGAIGIFPEGRIARRPGVITPFQPGVGLIIGRSRGVVLPAVLSGVPVHDSAYRAFFVRSRAKVAFMPPIDYRALGVKAGEIVPDLQSRYEEWVGPAVPPVGRARK